MLLSGLNKMVVRNFHIFANSEVISFILYGLHRIAPTLLISLWGYFFFTSIVLLLLPPIAVLYYCTAEIPNATSIYTKTIKDEKPTLLNDNCLTPICILIKGSKTITQGIETFSDSISFKLQRLKRLINLA